LTRYKFKQLKGTQTKTEKIVKYYEISIEVASSSKHANVLLHHRPRFQPLHYVRRGLGHLRK